ncbi:Hypothetical predicted protein [Octopus vulgaris]|uniref:Uncharacterized protein n=1 Tax=Octopus vulgaris TaxID=6645 RepID=A0AA36AP74_OCTVU|nr:Hypothetical predicted protein [Octopus vulgaris]
MMAFFVGMMVEHDEYSRCSSSLGDEDCVHRGNGSFNSVVVMIKLYKILVHWDLLGIIDLMEDEKSKNVDDRGKT